MEDKEKILTVRNLSVVLGKETAIDDVSFEVARGESLVIIGPNGSGKTTLLRTIIGALPYQGEIRLASGAKVGYVPQKLDIERNLPLSLRDFLRSKNSGTKELEEALRLVNLSETFLPKPIGSLSGGEFQRALIAFALLGKPDILMFDEPTASIDLPGEEQIYETLHRLQDEKGIALIIVSHDLTLVYRYANKVLCLNKKNLCFGLPEEVLNPKVLARLYGSSRQFYHHIHPAEISHHKK